jgi:hypothetical protein
MMRAIPLRLALLIALGLTTTGVGQTSQTSVTTARPGSSDKSKLPPLVLAEQGSFFVNSQTIETPYANGREDAGLVPGFTVFTNEAAWTAFRFGPSAFTPYPTTRFPVGARDEYFAQLVPNTETSYTDGDRITFAALAGLLDRIGPAVLLVHSQSGAYGIGTALKRPTLVKAVVSVEPRSCAISDADVQAVFARVPLLTMFGDFFGSDVSDWPGRMTECVATVRRIRDAKGTADNLHLQSLGIAGNSHMLMMDTNNLKLADLILSWLDRHARVG